MKLSQTSLYSEGTMMSCWGAAIQLVSSSSSGPIGRDQGNRSHPHEQERALSERGSCEFSKYSEHMGDMTAFRKQVCPLCVLSLSLSTHAHARACTCTHTHTHITYAHLLYGWHLHPCCHQTRWHPGFPGVFQVDDCHLLMVEINLVCCFALEKMN